MAFSFFTVLASQFTKARLGSSRRSRWKRCRLQLELLEQRWVLASPTYQWTGSGTTAWELASNWTFVNNGATENQFGYPALAGDVAQFISASDGGPSTFTAATTAMIGSNTITVGEIDFLTTIGVTFSATAGDSITLQGANNTAGFLDVQSSNATLTISAPILAPNGLNLINNNQGKSTISSAMSAASGSVSIANTAGAASTFSGAISAPNGSVTITNQPAGATTYSGAISASNAVNIKNTPSSGATTYSGTISANGGLNINILDAANTTFTKAITANAGAIITVQPIKSVGNVTFLGAITAPNGLTATILPSNGTAIAGLLALSGANSTLNNGKYIIGNGGTLEAGANQAFGTNATIEFNSGLSTCSDTTAVTLTDNFVFDANASANFSGSVIMLTNSTITLNGADAAVLGVNTTFSGLINGATSNSSLTINGPSYEGALGNTTFAGYPLTLSGSALNVNGSVTFTANTPTIIQTTLNETGPLTLTGTSLLTLSGVGDAFSGGASIGTSGGAGGIVLVDSPGSLSVSPSLVVYGHSTLGGTGSISGSILVPGGTVMPGDPTSQTGNVLSASYVDFTNGGTLLINVTGYTTAGTDYNLLNLNGGTLNLDNSSTITVNLSNSTVGGIASGVITNVGSILLNGNGSGSFPTANFINPRGFLPFIDYSTPNQVNVDVYQTPTITTAGSVTFTVNSSGSFTPLASGFPTPNTITEAGSLPSGVTYTGGVLSGTPNPGSAGIYNDTFTTTNTIHSVVQSFSQNFMLTVVGVGTTTTLADLGPNPSFPGSSVTFTTTVTPTGQSASLLAGDTVSLVDASNGDATIASMPLNSNGSATFAVTSLAIGSHSIFALYAGDPTFASSQSTEVSQSVLSNTATFTSLAQGKPDPSSFGGSVTFTVAVAANGSVTGDIVSLVDASQGNATIGSTALNSVGSASFSVSSLATGSHSIFALFAGDVNHNGSQSADVIQYVQGNTTTTLTDNTPNPSTDAQAETFTVTVVGNNITPSGTVTLYDASQGNVSIGSSALNSNGNATITINAGVLPLGSNSIYAVYGSDSTNLGSQSNQVVQTVNPGVYDWTGAAGDSNWANPLNWDVGGVAQTANGYYPNNVGDTAQFISTGYYTLAQTPEVLGNTTVTVGEIDVGGTVAVAIGAPGGGGLILQNSARPAIINDSISTSSALTLSAPISAPNSLNVTTNQTGGTIIISGPISAATGNVSFTLASGAATTISGAISTNGSVTIVNQDTAATTVSGGITAATAVNITYQSATAFTIGTGMITVGSPSAAGTVTLTDLDPKGNTLTFSAPIASPSSLNLNIVSNVTGLGDIDFSGTISAGTNAGNNVNIEFDDTSANTTDILGSVLAGGSVNIIYDSGTTANINVSGSIQAPSLNITLQSNMGATATETITGMITGATTTFVNATVNSGTLVFGNALSQISGNSSYAVSAGGDLRASATQAFGSGTTIILTGGTLDSNVAAGVTLTNNLVIGTNASFTLGAAADPLTFTNSTITLNGADSVANISSTTFNGLITGATANESLAINGSGSFALGNATFAGNPVTLTGSATLSVNGSDSLMVSTPSIIKNNLIGTGSLALTGTSALTLLGADIFSGGTSVGMSSAQVGTLIVDGSVAAGVTVNQGSLLMGDGSVGALTVLGGTVRPSDPSLNGGFGILSASSATSTGGTLVIQVAGYTPPGTPGGDYDQLYVAGALSLDSTSSITLNLSNLSYGGIAAGIIDYGSFSGGIPSVNIINNSKGLPVSLDTTTFGVVNLDVMGSSSFTSANGATFTVNSSSSFTVQPNGFPTPTLTETGSLPSGVTFNAGVLSGTPAPSSAGIYHDTFTAKNSLGSVPQSFTLTVNAIGTTTTLTDLGPNPSFIGSSVTFTTAVTPGSLLNGETVTLEDASNGNASVGSGTLNNGSATITVNDLTVGSHSIFAVYRGDATFAASQSTDVVQVILNNTTTATMLTDLGPNPSVLGGSVTFTTAVETENISITGETVTLEDASNGNATVGSGTLNSNNSATITVSNLAVGSHSIFAVYAGDANGETGSQSGSVIQVVQASTTTTLTDLGPNPSLLNLAATFSVSVTSGTTVPGGTVTLEDASNGNASVGSGTLTNGSATISVSSLTVGSHSLFAVYGSDSTHAGSQSNQVSQAVGGLFASLSGLPSVEASPQFYVYWSGAAAPGWSITGYTIYVSDDGGPYAAWPQETNTTATSGAYQGQYGQTYSFYSVTNGTDTLGNSQTSLPSMAISTTVPSAASLTVTSFTPTATGFTAAFNEPFLNTSTNPIHLFSAPASNANYGSPDVTVVGPSGAVTGSLIVNAANTGFTFIKTDVATSGGTTGLLAPGTYTVTFLSGTTGFQDANGNQLNSTGAGLAGSNYVTTFTVTAPVSNAVTVSIPDFARGPDSADSINLINTSSNGIPVSLSNGSGVTSGSVTVTYNPSQLNIAGAFPNPALGNASFSLDPASTPGTAILDFNSPTPLAAGAVTLGGLIAYTPSNAAYKSKELLQIASSLNGGAIPTINDNAVQVVAYLGNVSGSGFYSGLDSGEMLNIISGSDAGFSQFPVIDPAILGGITGDSQVSISDILQLNARIATGSNPYVPFIAPGIGLNNPAGPDPTLSIPVLTMSANGTVLVPVNIDDADPAGSTGMTVAQLALKYDPSEFSVQDVQLGSVPESGTRWTLRTVVDAATGTIGVTLSSETPIVSTAGGSLVVIALREQATATPEAASLELVASETANGQVFSTSVNDMQGPFTLTPAPTNTGTAPGLEGLAGTNIATVTISSSNVEPAAALPELAIVEYVTQPTPAVVTAAAITDLPVGVIEDHVENTAAALTDAVLEPSAANSMVVNADHEAAALAPSVLVNANVGIEALPANGFMFTISAAPAPVAGGNPLFNESMGPQSANLSLSVASASKQAGQRLADQLFQDLSLGEAGPALSTAASARDWLRDDEQPFDLLSQKEEEWTTTNIGDLDGYFALIAADGAADGE